MLIDLLQLRTFVAVAEEQHLTRAAERLHISQSAASAHVRGVEERLGTKLFVRTKRSLELTRAGILLLREAKILLNQANRFNSFAREIHGKAEGRVVLSTASEPTSSRVDQIVAELRVRHPLIKLDVRTQAAPGAQQGLKTGEIDIAVQLGEPTDERLTHYHLTMVPFRVAGPIAWREKIESAGWAELATMPWIVPDERSQAYTSMLETLFKKRGLEVNTTVVFDNASLGISLVQAGVGMLLMREEHAFQGVRKGTLAVSPLARAQIDLVVMHAVGRENDPLIRAVMGAARAAWSNLRTEPALASKPF